MQVQVNTNSSIQGDERLTAYVQDVVARELIRFSDQITRVEVHLSDQNSQKGGDDDKRCVMEARLADRQPTAVTHKAPTVPLAVDGAAGKLGRALASTLGKLHR